MGISRRFAFSSSLFVCSFACFLAHFTDNSGTL
jgi:hypothetical protein